MLLALKRIAAFAGLALAALSSPSFSQTGNWSYVSGSGGLYYEPGEGAAYDEWPASYGVLGVPSGANSPGSLDNAAAWTGKDGNFWLFGGMGFQGSEVEWVYGGALNTLWKLDPARNVWTWMGGSNNIQTTPPVGVYGSRFIASRANIPGGREGATALTGVDGSLWLFGGYYNGGTGKASSNDTFNDLWQFNPTTLEWTWMAGSSKLTHQDTTGNYQPGVYGTRGTPSEANTPGSRASAAGWTDLRGSLWLYGGYGYDSTGKGGYLNDLWAFDPSERQWIWEGGSESIPSDPAPVYGHRGVFASSNSPGGRTGEATWIDSDGNFWLFGGAIASADSYDPHYLNDLWEFNFSKKEWAWIAGPDTLDQPGVYAKSASSSVIPGARSQATVWKDSKGIAWIFGGTGYDSAGNNGTLDDLWSFNPANGAWTWVSGDSTLPSQFADEEDGIPFYAVPVGSRSIGSLSGAPGWIDKSDNLWIYAGTGWTHNFNSGSSADPNYLQGDFNNLHVSQRRPNTVRAPLPYLSLAPGAFKTPQKVQVLGVGASPTIYYTLDGSNPTLDSRKAAGVATFNLSATTTLKAMAVVNGFSASETITAAYEFPYKAQSVTFTQPAGTTMGPYGPYINIKWPGKPILLQVDAKSSSGLPVTFKVVGGSAAVTGHNLWISEYGEVDVQASQAGNDTYAPASTDLTIYVNLH